jgi:hypothetical protein
MEIPEMNQKDELILCGNRFEDFYIKSTMLLKIVAFKPTIRIFLNTLKVHIEGIRHPPPPYSYLTHFFRVSVPLKTVLEV